MNHTFEFYETPAPFTRWLFDATPVGIKGTILEPACGSLAIPLAAPIVGSLGERTWVTNDLDPRWPADYHEDARNPRLYERVARDRGSIDWIVTNPPFTPAITMIRLALAHARVGVAMHLRASIHEVLKTGERRTFMAEHPPTGILWLPRFAYQRSKTTDEWTTDSVCACWCVWLKGREHDVAPWTPGQFIRYAPERVIDELAAITPDYRARMDRLMAERKECTA